ncbi:mlr9555 (plasmid) [Mesorhizobium japonicum MAFF 303099]|uniref:Mlr9555 protein n=1 Tax=Mesorhizobium japonicum (strain LMG 29417 / CECT 9101 / MAFF 303099) TaxID=266835 RepID=Q98P97_RHILO|nr:mlr9555 [Mesorhizobium japonicum MAFF 303099]
MPTAEEPGFGIVAGGPYSSGALVGGPNFKYAPATPATLDRVARNKAIADSYGISMKAAGLQFSLAHPAVAAVIPGAGRIAEDRAAPNEMIPAEFWPDRGGRGSSIRRRRHRARYDTISERFVAASDKTISPGVERNSAQQIGAHTLMLESSDFGIVA